MDFTKEVLKNQIEIKQINDEEYHLKLLCGQIDRDQYEAIDEILKRLWGKWKGNKKVHVFNYDPQPSIIEYVETGLLPPKNATAYFPTPKVIVQEGISILKHNSGYERNLKILEPSAGQGAIIEELINYFEENKQLFDNEKLDNEPVIEKIDCFEILDLNYKILKRKGFNPRQEDFLKANIEDEKYDIIFMNPPFSVDDLQDCYIDHIIKAYNLIKPEGELLAICPLGFTYKTNKKNKEFRELLSLNGFVYPVESGNFKESGTMIDTCFVHLNGSWYTKQTLDEYNGYKTYYHWLFSMYADGNMCEDPFINIKGNRNDRKYDDNLYWDKIKMFKTWNKEFNDIQAKNYIQKVLDISHTNSDGLRSDMFDEYIEILKGDFEEFLND